MKGFSLALAATTVFSAFNLVAADVDPIVVKGSKFFYKTNGTQFYIRGVAYQSDSSNTTGTETFVDPLADATGCARDIPLMQALGTNTIRVYALDTTADHSACMKLLQAAGIYIVADLSEPGTSINRDSPAWDVTLYNRYTSVIDLLAPYSNVLGFFAGNEVTNSNNNTNASPFVKAAVRDMKAYIATKKYRSIPVGYATNDDSTIRNDLADYFNCGATSDSIDFWGYNIYSWCGSSSLQTSGYADRTAEFANYSVPTFFAEYGCNLVTPRLFTEVAAIYGSSMDSVWSGGIVYQYFEETNNYGLVSVNSAGTATKLADYTNLQSQLAKATPTGVAESSYTVTNTAARACPTSDGVSWAASTVLPPTPNSDLCNCMVTSVGCNVASSVETTQYSELFAYVCAQLGTNGCAGITANGTTGSYGAYSNCPASARLAWAFNQYYVAKSKSSTACDFSGAGVVQSGSVNSTCKSSLASAASSSGTSTSSGTSSSSGSTTTTAKSAAMGTFNSNIPMSFFGMTVAVVAAFFGGVGMMVL